MSICWLNIFWDDTPVSEWVSESKRMFQKIWKQNLHIASEASMLTTHHHTILTFHTNALRAKNDCYHRAFFFLFFCACNAMYFRFSCNWCELCDCECVRERGREINRAWDASLCCAVCMHININVTKKASLEKITSSEQKRHSVCVEIQNKWMASRMNWRREKKKWNTQREKEKEEEVEEREKEE